MLDWKAPRTSGSFASDLGSRWSGDTPLPLMGARRSLEVASLPSEGQILRERQERMRWPLLAGGRIISLRRRYQSTYRLALIRTNPLMSHSTGEAFWACSAPCSPVRVVYFFVCMHLGACVCVRACTSLFCLPPWRLSPWRQHRQVTDCPRDASRSVLPTRVSQATTATRSHARMCKMHTSLNVFLLEVKGWKVYMRGRVWKCATEGLLRLW